MFLQDISADIMVKTAPIQNYFGLGKKQLVNSLSVPP